MEELLISESSTTEHDDEYDYDECRLCEDRHQTNELIELYDDVFICFHCIDCINSIS